VAKDYQEVRQVILDAAKFAGFYVLAVWVILIMSQSTIITAFDAGTEAAG